MYQKVTSLGTRDYSTTMKPGNIAERILGFFGWKVDHRLPPVDKLVVIGAPHTSNWDLPLGLLAMWALHHNFYWVAKHTIFIGPAGWLFRKLGGIPVDRRVHTGFINRAAESIKEKDRIAMVIAPEGTRAKTEYWKAGFYHIAMEAGVPIGLGYIDCNTKTIGVGATLWPTGDMEKDFEAIKKFYADKKGIRPHLQGEIRIRPQKATRTT